MPTGLTNPIYTGTDTSLRGFMLRCLPHFGAGFRWCDRDVRAFPLDKCPDVEVSQSTQNDYQRAVSSLENFLSLEKTEQGKAILLGQYENYVRSRTQENIDWRKKVVDAKQLYLNMKHRVESMELPEDELEEVVAVRDYMLNQLETSMAADCKDDDWVPNHGEPMTFEQWMVNEKEQKEWEVNYHKKELEEENRFVENDRKVIRRVYELLDRYDPVWTVANAKKGDYLFLKGYSEDDPGMLVIFKELERDSKGNTYENLPHHDFCRYHLGSHTFEFDHTIYKLWTGEGMQYHMYLPYEIQENRNLNQSFTSKDEHRCGFSKGYKEMPATREQRHLLNKVLEESHMYFDTEKMELMRTGELTNIMGEIIRNKEI